MWPKSVLSLVSAALLASSVVAQRYTTTLPYVDGDTLVLSVGTNVLGQPFTTTLSTITAGIGGITTVPTTRTTTSSSTTSTSTRRTTTTTAAVTGPTTTGPRVVGQETTAPPMRTTTYWHDPGNGVWTVATWTASVTAAPQVATANVPSGTIQDYNSYQTVVNSAVLASAQAAAVSGSRSGGVAKVAGWGGMAVGAIAGAAGIMAL